MSYPPCEEATTKARLDRLLLAKRYSPLMGARNISSFAWERLSHKNKAIKIMSNSNLFIKCVHKKHRFAWPFPNVLGACEPFLFLRKGGEKHIFAERSTIIRFYGGSTDRAKTKAIQEGPTRICPFKCVHKRHRFAEPKRVGSLRTFFFTHDGRAKSMTLPIRLQFNVEKLACKNTSSESQYANFDRVFN